MGITKVKTNPIVKEYRRAWKLYQLRLIDKDGLMKILNNIN